MVGGFFCYVTTLYYPAGRWVPYGSLRFGPAGYLSALSSLSCCERCPHCRGGGWFATNATWYHPVVDVGLPDPCCFLQQLLPQLFTGHTVGSLPILRCVHPFLRLDCAVLIASAPKFLAVLLRVTLGSSATCLGLSRPSCAITRGPSDDHATTSSGANLVH